MVVSVSIRKARGYRVAQHLIAVLLIAGGSGLHVTGTEERLSSSAGDIVIRPLAHASVRLDFAGRSIYVDPWSGADLTDFPRSDLIIVTDADNGSHHLDVTALARVRTAGGTVVVPASGRQKVPDGVVLENGAARTFGDVRVEVIAAYDLTPGQPFHAKGVGNGYVLTLGGKRVYFAGVTECVPEIKALRDIDIAFMPMNLPNGRMTPEAVAECVRSFHPKVVYPYHYDQDYLARRAGRGNPAGAATAAASVRTLAVALKGIAEVREGGFYPAP
jgi:L-ascorbate metabolism protein UlaG (beta-lactamase superfamily)